MYTNLRQQLNKEAKIRTSDDDDVEKKMEEKGVERRENEERCLEVRT